LTHAADAPGHGAHDVAGEIRHLVDHEAELALVDDRQLDRSLTRAVELRAAPSITDMKPIASFGPQTSITVSPITISMTPDCTTYMQVPGSPLLKTMLPAENVTLAPARLANMACRCHS
jgi:hypothetical protein